MKNKTLFFLLLGTIIASVYVTLCVVLQPISFGPIQLRISEMLCLLSIDYSWGLFGVSLGCLLANMFVGGLGIIDIIFGTLATVIGCTLAYLFRNIRYKGYPILSAMMIVLVNGIIIGIELAYVFDTKDLVWLYMFQVGLGEFLAIIPGLFIYKRIKQVIDEKLKV